VRRVKAKWYECVKLKDIEAVYDKVLAAALAGDMTAAKLYLERTMGKTDHTYDPRQSLPAEGEQQSQGPQYTAQERLIIARTMAAQAERELRGEEAIEAEGEEMRDG
jgi:hypothetical protein